MTTKTKGPAEFGRMAMRLHAQNRKIEIGSDVEIAQILGRELANELGQIVSAEGDFWHYVATEGRWRMLDRMWCGGSLSPLMVPFIRSRMGATMPSSCQKVELPRCAIACRRCWATATFSMTSR